MKDHAKCSWKPFSPIVPNLTAMKKASAQRKIDINAGGSARYKRRPDTVQTRHAKNH
jgi:FtsZ-interacting cell division protein YlmF